MGAPSGLFNLYLAALWTVPIAIYLLGLYYQRHGATILFWLPLTHLVCATAFIFVQFNIAYLSVTDETTLRGLLTFANVCDACSTVALCFANLLRLRFVIRSGVRLGDLPAWCLPLSWLMGIPGAVFPVASVVSIVCLFNSELAAAGGGNVCFYVPNAFNLFYSSTEIVFHVLFGLFLLRQASLAPLRVRLIWAGFSALLVGVGAGEVSGAIVSFWQPEIGVIITYSFWLSNNAAFLTMNRLVNKKLKSYSGAVIPTPVVRPD